SVEAIRAGGIAPFSGALRGALPALAGECFLAAAHTGVERSEPDYRRIATDARAAAIDPDRGQVACDGVDPGGERHRQGTDRRRASYVEPAPAGELCPNQLRSHSGGAVGERVVWP